MAEDDKGTQEGPAGVAEELRAVMEARENDAPDDQAGSGETGESPEDSAVAEDESADAPDGDSDSAAQGGETGEDDGEEGPEDGGDAPEGDSDPDVIPAPSNWSEEDRTDFETLDPEGRETFLRMYRRMEGSFTPHLMELSGIRRTLQPIQADITASGMKPEEVIGRLVGYHVGLKRDAEGTILKLAEEHGVKLPTGEDEDYLGDDERIDALNKQIETLTTEIRSLKEPSAQRPAEGGDQQRWAKFRDATNPDGSLQHPHLEQVMGRMEEIATLASVQKQNVTIESVYQQAVVDMGLKNGKKAPTDGKSESERKRAALKRKKDAAAGARGNSSSSAVKTEKDFKSYADDMTELAGKAGLLNKPAGRI